jgi:drug/metabolite transporter (DMT)-like permease
MDEPAPVGPAAEDDPGSVVHSRTAAILLLVVLTLIWGVHWVVVKVGVTYMPPLGYATLRLASGLATVVLVLGLQGRLRPPPREDLPIVLSVGLGQIAAGILIINFVILAVGAGRSSVLQFTMPLWVAILGAVFFRVRPRPHEAIGLALGIVGLTVLFNPVSVDWSQSAEVVGMAALLANAALWGAVTIHIRRHTWRSTPGLLQPWQLLAALLPVAVATFVIEGSSGITWSVEVVLILLYSGPLATAFGFWASQAVTRALGSQASATGFLAIPVVGLVSGAVFLGEALGPLDVVGFTLVLGGVGLASLWTPRGARATG